MRVLQSVDYVCLIDYESKSLQKHPDEAKTNKPILTEGVVRFPSVFFLFNCCCILQLSIHLNILDLQRVASVGQGLEGSDDDISGVVDGFG